MANTYTLIQSVAVGSGGAARIVFGSIPQTFTDLQLVVSGRSTDTITGFQCEFNSSGSNHSGKPLEADGASAYSYNPGGSTIVGLIPPSSSTASVFGSTTIYIPNYTSSTFKSFSADAVTENNAATAYLIFFAKLWSDTSAITSISIYPQISNFAQYSSASLYGIKNS
jgi:hypothetical protein